MMKLNSIILNDIHLDYISDDYGELIELQLRYRDRYVKIDKSNADRYKRFIEELLSATDYLSMIKIITNNIPPTAEVFHTENNRIALIGYDPDYIDILKDRQRDVMVKGKMHEADKR